MARAYPRRPRHDGAEIRRVLHKAWNFFKHGDRDPEAVLEFDTGEVDYIIFHATLECGEIAKPSMEMQVFQLWFLASGTFRLDDDDEIQRFSEALFAGLADLPRSERLRRGHDVLMRQLEDEEEPNKPSQPIARENARSG